MSNRDITGHRFARLTAVRQVGNSKGGSALWLFACDCGGETTTLATHARTGHKALPPLLLPAIKRDPLQVQINNLACIWFGPTAPNPAWRVQ